MLTVARQLLFCQSRIYNTIWKQAADVELRERVQEISIPIDTKIDPNEYCTESHARQLNFETTFQACEALERNVTGIDVDDRLHLRKIV